MNTNVIETSIQNHVRFPHKGYCTTEDLYYLSLRELNAIYKTLKRLERDTVEESLAETASQENKLLELQIETVKHVYGVKQAEKEAKEQVLERSAKKAQLMALIEQKQEQGLAEKPVEELMEMLAEL